MGRKFEKDAIRNSISRNFGQHRKCIPRCYPGIVRLEQGCLLNPFRQIFFGLTYNQEPPW